MEWFEIFKTLSEQLPETYSPEVVKQMLDAHQQIIKILLILQPLYGIVIIIGLGYYIWKNEKRIKKLEKLQKD